MGGIVLEAISLIGVNRILEKVF